jgi:hypothetical protein
MPLMISRLRFGFTPRRFIGMSGSNTTHCRSFNQNSLAIDPLLSTKELESDPPASGQANNWVQSLRGGQARRETIAIAVQPATGVSVVGFKPERPDEALSAFG